MAKRNVCDDCGEDCDIDLRHIALELPDFPHTAHELCWVSTCCEATYDIIHEEHDETD